MSLLQLFIIADGNPRYCISRGRPLLSSNLIFGVAGRVSTAVSVSYGRQCRTLSIRDVRGTRSSARLAFDRGRPESHVGCLPSKWADEDTIASIIISQRGSVTPARRSRRQLIERGSRLRVPSQISPVLSTPSTPILTLTSSTFMRTPSLKLSGRGCRKPGLSRKYWPAV